ncbi:MAG: ArdC-like ssDNA-binding domain-containing protein [Marinosulfonomonas sp.]
MTTEKFDVYTHVTNQIVAQIEAGTPPWRKPWTGGGSSVSLPERFNGEAYRV